MRHLALLLPLIPAFTACGAKTSHDLVLSADTTITDTPGAVVALTLPVRNPFETVDSFALRVVPTLPPTWEPLLCYGGICSRADTGRVTLDARATDTTVSVKILGDTLPDSGRFYFVVSSFSLPGVRDSVLVNVRLTR